MAFNNPVVGGDTLVRPAIQSANYIPGVQGWSINRDGSAEFATGTFRGPVIVIDPVTGTVLASIGANGNVAAQDVTVTGDVIIGTLSVLAAIQQATEGVVGWFQTSGTLPAAGFNNTFTNILWCNCQLQAGRLYKIGIANLQMFNPDTFTAENVYVKINIAQPGGISGWQGWLDSGALEAGNFGAINGEVLFNSTHTGPAQVQLQISTSDTVAWAGQPTAVANGATIWVEDAGEFITASGGTGAASGAVTTDKKYTALASKSYDNSGAFIGSPDGTNNMYQGTLSGRSHGTESAAWSFAGSTMASDIAGAVINSAKLWMYCTNSSGASGGVNISMSTATTPPTTAPPTGSNNTNFSSNWPVPGWAGVDITSYLSLGASLVILEHAIIDGSASFYGFGTAGFQPYIEINYTK
jgi:hypothetical protein